MRKREANFDLLRIICCVAVIAIHVSCIYKDAITDMGVFGFYYADNMLYTLLWNVLSRFAVPCFLMISGAFLLSDERNSSIKYFYRKAIKSIGVAVFLFCCFAVFFAMCKPFIKMFWKLPYNFDFIQPVINALKGVPYYHLWYLSVLTVIYLLIPFVLKFKKVAGERLFNRLVIVYFIWAIISGVTSSYSYYWSLTCVLPYLGFVLMGYELRRNTVKDNRKAFVLIVAGLLWLVCLCIIQYRHSLAGIAEAEEAYTMVDAFNPLIAIGSILIFKGFVKLDFNHDFGKLPKYTLYIYMWHALILYFIQQGFEIYCGGLSNIIVIPVLIVIIFVLSYMFSIPSEKLVSRITSDDKFMCKLYDILGISDK